MAHQSCIQVKYSYSLETEAGIKRKNATILVMADNLIEVEQVVAKIGDNETVIESTTRLKGVLHVDGVREYKEELPDGYFYWKVDIEIPTDEAPLKESLFIVAETNDEASNYAHGILGKGMLAYKIVGVNKKNIEAAIEFSYSSLTKEEEQEVVEN